MRDMGRMMTGAWSTNGQWVMAMGDGPRSVRHEGENGRWTMGDGRSLREDRRLWMAIDNARKVREDGRWKIDLNIRPLENQLSGL